MIIRLLPSKTFNPKLLNFLYKLFKPVNKSIDCLIRLAIANYKDCYSKFRIKVDMQKLIKVKAKIFTSLLHSPLCQISNLGLLT